MGTGRARLHLRRQPRVLRGGPGHAGPGRGRPHGERSRDGRAPDGRAPPPGRAACRPGRRPRTRLDDRPGAGEGPRNEGTRPRSCEPRGRPRVPTRAAAAGRRAEHHPRGAAARDRRRGRGPGTDSARRHPVRERLRISRTLAVVALLAASALALTPAPPAPARKPVLAQVKVPHPYYWREMYVPQVTSGPGAAAWSPDGAELVYAMQGSLWRQKLGSDEALQLT